MSTLPTAPGAVDGLSAVTRQQATLPKRLVTAVIGLAFLPLFLNGLGISFSAVDRPAAERSDSAIAQQVDQSDALARGEIIYVLLEWTAFMIALATAIFALTHYFVANDVTTPTISTALFFSGMIDAFQSLAAVHLLPFVADETNFLPFTWFISRLVNVCFLIAGTLPFVWQAAAAARPRNKDPRFLMLTAILFAVLAYVIVFLCARSSHLPASIFPGFAIVHRPWDLIPLFLYLFAGATVFPRFHRAQPSLFSHAIFVSVIPNVASEVYAAFVSTTLYDNGFNIAAIEKIIAYLVPFMGLLLDYRRVYNVDVALQVADEKIRVARNVQQGLIPHGSPHLPGFDIAGAYLPADLVGGDYYDYVPLSDGRLGIVVADVSGHEIGASLLMAKTRAYLRALAKSGNDLQTLLSRVHDFLLEDTKDQWFVTMFFSALDPKSDLLEYAGAAQQAHILRADGAITLLNSTSAPLGVFPDHPPRVAPPLALHRGDLLVAVTDGITEAKSRSGEQFGYTRLIEVVQKYRESPAIEIVNAMTHAVRAFCNDAPFADDVTIVVVRRT